MTEHMHNFKWHVRYKDNYKPPRWSYDGRECWLGSGINDHNGVEIFEGDKVIFGERDTQGVIVFKDAMFQIKHSDKFTALGNCQGFIEVEVIGHIAEEDYLEPYNPQI